VDGRVVGLIRCRRRDISGSYRALVEAIMWVACLIYMCETVRSSGRYGRVDGGRGRCGCMEVASGRKKRCSGDLKYRHAWGWGKDCGWVCRYSEVVINVTNVIDLV
jgi:hypothetical protein